MGKRGRGILGETGKKKAKRWDDNGEGVRGGGLGEKPYTTRTTTTTSGDALYTIVERWEMAVANMGEMNTADQHSAISIHLAFFHAISPSCYVGGPDEM